jgi:minor extracellular serine protease Vpr
MKKLLHLLLACSISAAALAQNAAPKLSPFTKKYLQEYNYSSDRLPDGFVYKKDAAGNKYISVLIKVTDAALAQSGLDGIGAHVGTKAGAIWTVQVPVFVVDQLITLNGIAYVQVDEPMVSPTLNQARIKTRVDSVHGGYNLPQPYTGKDVVMGIIDFGFDYNHPAMFDTLFQNYRVKRVWELNTTGAPPSGYNYGHEMVTTNTIQSQGTDNIDQTHGTMVAGMASGSGYGGDVTNRKYRGMAFDADMVFVGVRRDSIGGQWMSSGFSDFLDGINYIFTYAGSVSKPAVVNISWGSQSGPHDGTSLFNQGCDALAGPGKLIVMSAGNEGQEQIHLSKTFTPSDSVIHTFTTFSPTPVKRTWVDVWGDTSHTMCAKVTLYSGGMTVGNTTGFICIDDQNHSTYLIGNNGLDTCYVEFLTSSSEFNQKPRMIVNIYNKATDSVLVSVSGTSGSIDMWNEYYYYGFPYQYQSIFNNLNQAWASTGNTVTTVSDMGASESVLLVGAYTSKKDWIDINGNPLSYGVAVNGITPFSSRGPYVDGRFKPDITAPGLTVGTAVSSYDTAYTPTGSNSDLTLSSYTDMSSNTYYYSEFSGTSASAPASSGIVALLLQINPALTPAEMKDIIFTTAIHDVFVGNTPNNTWGEGKINAYGAVKKLIQQMGVYNFSGNKLDCVLFPNPSSGKFTLDYTTKQAETVNVEVLNITGAQVLSTQWKVNSGTNLKDIDLGDMPKGNYLVKVSAKDGAVVIKAAVK